MTPGFLTFAATLGGFIAVIVGLKLALEPASALRLGIFRPYRGHSWARGVQEDDTVRFTWARRRVARGPIQPSWSEIAVTPNAEGSGRATDPASASIEDVTAETAVVRPVEDVSVHQLRR